MRKLEDVSGFMKSFQFVSLPTLYRFVISYVCVFDWKGLKASPINFPALFRSQRYRRYFAQLLEFMFAEDDNLTCDCCVQRETIPRLDDAPILFNLFIPMVIFGVFARIFFERSCCDMLMITSSMTCCRPSVKML